MELNTPAGFRDYLPEEQELRKKLLSIMERKFLLYGYESIDTPAVEFLDILKKKSGQEIEEQIFKIEGEDIALRFDHTVPLARFVASNKALYRPFKRYVIGKVWRNEEPQRGRYREFIQADVDIVGSSSLNAELELLELAKDIFEEIGFEDVVFYINDREFLSAFADANRIEEKARFFRAIDKWDKIGEQGVKKELEAFMEKGKVSSLLSSLKQITLEGVKEYSLSSYERLSYILNFFDRAVFKPTLVRGLDYYTSTIFEAVRKGDNLSIGGGGRYDNLISLYGNVDIPAVGFSFGFERIYSIINSSPSLVKRFRDAKKVVYVAYLKGMFEKAFSISKTLRKQSIAVDMNYEEKSLKAQLSYANNKNYKLVIIVAPKEMEEKKVVVRNMETKEEKKLSISSLAKEIKRLL